MTKTIEATTKVLPFTNVKGEEVKGHEISAFNQEGWNYNPIEKVVFESWDKEAEMMVEHAIHWTRLTKFLQCKEYAGSIKAVLLRDGTRIHAKSYSVGYYDDAAYLAAPPICRGVFRINALCSGTTLVEVVGVGQWLRSKRDAEATAKYLIDPWERDNAAYQARIDALNKGE